MTVVVLAAVELEEEVELSAIGTILSSVPVLLPLEAFMTKTVFPDVSFVS